MKKAPIGKTLAELLIEHPRRAVAAAIAAIRDVGAPVAPTQVQAHSARHWLYVIYYILSRRLGMEGADGQIRREAQYLGVAPSSEDIAKITVGVLPERQRWRAGNIGAEAVLLPALRLMDAMLYGGDGNGRWVVSQVDLLKTLLVDWEDHPTLHVWTLFYWHQFEGAIDPTIEGIRDEGWVKGHGQDLMIANAIERASDHGYTRTGEVFHLTVYSLPRYGTAIIPERGCEPQRDLMRFERVIRADGEVGVIPLPEGQKTMKLTPLSHFIPTGTAENNALTHLVRGHVQTLKRGFRGGNLKGNEVWVCNTKPPRLDERMWVYTRTVPSLKLTPEEAEAQGAGVPDGGDMSKFRPTGRWADCICHDARGNSGFQVEYFRSRDERIDSLMGVMTGIRLKSSDSLLVVDSRIHRTIRALLVSWMPLATERQSKIDLLSRGRTRSDSIDLTSIPLHLWQIDKNARTINPYLNGVQVKVRFRQRIGDASTGLSLGGANPTIGISHEASRLSHYDGEASIYGLRSEIAWPRVYGKDYTIRVSATHYLSRFPPMGLADQERVKHAGVLKL